MPEGKPFSEPRNIFESHIAGIFNTETEEIDVILSIISILVFKNIRDKSLLSLYKQVDLESFMTILSTFEGRTITFPSKEEIEELFILGICYYYKEVEGMNWEQIKEQMPFEIKATTYGLKINSLSSMIRKKLSELVQGVK